MEFYQSSSLTSDESTGLRPARRLRLALLGMAVLVAGASAGAVAWTGRSTADAAVEAAAPLPVALMTAERQPAYERDRVYPGRIAAARRSDLAFERAGLLMAVHADDGDRVAAGAVLAQLDIAPLERRRAELVARRDATDARRRLAEATLARQSVLVDRGHSSGQTLDDTAFEAEALAAEVAGLDAAIAAIDLDIEKSTLRAPYAGRIERRTADEGTVVEAGSPVLRLIESGRQEARIGVPEAVSRDLTVGRAYPLETAGRTVTATLRNLTPSLDAATRTVTAVFDLSGEAGMPGDLVRLRHAERIAEPGFWLPRPALSESLRGLWAVYIAVPDGGADDGRLVVRRADVEILHAEADRVFARGTFGDGAAIIADGAHRVVPGMAVTAADNGPLMAEAD